MLRLANFGYVALLICIAGHPAAAKAADAGPTQVDGIVSGVVDRLWQVEDTYFDHGDYVRAIDIGRIIVSADPNFVECYVSTAWLLDSDGDRADAEALYRLACANNPTDSYAYYNLGMFYFNSLHDYPKARVAFEYDISHCADLDANDYKMLAHTYQRLKMFNQSLTILQTAAKMWPNDLTIKKVMIGATERARTQQDTTLATQPVGSR